MAFDSAPMDQAAEQAAKDLEKLNHDAVSQVADWWKSHYLQAGHKRLGRKLLERATSETAELEKLVKQS